MIRLSILLMLSAVAALGASDVDSRPDPARAQELRDYIQKEKPAFRERENQKKDLLEELDKLNADQNRIRERVSDIQANQQEMTMALENMDLEHQKQKKMEAFERQRLLLLFKVVYKIKRDGILRFLVYGESLGTLATRIRVLYRTLRSHSQLTQQLQERAVRLAESEKKLSKAQLDLQQLMGELNEQQDLLQNFLRRKKELLRALNRKQTTYQTALKEYKEISAQLSALFNDLESEREGSPDETMPAHGSLPLPIEGGKIIKNFGRSVNPRFGTVTYQKGIEIEAEHNTPVKAILSGVVEFDGWVKGLGNVVILHHGSGFYSLSAHLFKALKTRGTRVETGDVIGLVGDTGTNETPSLYFELRENNRAVDPVLFFNHKALQNLG